MKFLKGIIILLIILAIGIGALMVYINMTNEGNDDIIVNINVENKIANNIVNNAVNNTTNNTVNNIVNDKNVVETNEISEETNDGEEETNNIIGGMKPLEVNKQYVFTTAENCIKKYLSYIFSCNNVAVYDILDNEFIEANGFTIRNILDNVNIYTNSEVSKAIQMYKIAGARYSRYYVKYQTGEKIVYFIINMNITTDTFSIIPIREASYNEEILKTVVLEEKEIQKNDYNAISYTTN